MVVGKALMNLATTVCPTAAPKSLIRPPPPFGAVLPTHTPTTMLGL
jgi:hypothetical protein